MFDIGISELLLIIALVVIFVKPEEVPIMLKKTGAFIRRVKLFFYQVNTNIDNYIDSYTDELMEKQESTKVSETDLSKLLEKYNYNTPRYTSYPTILDWENNASVDDWMESAKKKYEETGQASLYLHIPFCRELCTFCACNKIITSKYELAQNYIKYLQKELDQYLQYFGVKKINIHEIHFGGGTPVYLKPKELDELLKFIFQRINLTSDASLSIEVDPRVTTREHLETLRKYGFNRISIGVQDFDHEVQITINRVNDFEMVEKVTEEARELGFSSVNYDLVYGLPNQTLESIKLTCDNIALLKPDRIAFYSYAHVPWVVKGQTHFTTKYKLPLGQEKISLYLLGRNMLTKLGYLDIGFDHFALPGDKLFTAMKNGTLHRNFMGFVDRSSYPLIGLGVSAVSDADFCYKQNEKDLDKYQETIEKGEVSLIRSHMLKDAEYVQKKHILDLTTQFATALNKEEYAAFSVNECAKEMIEDGLVILTKDRLEIAPMGRLFVRNICTLFDVKFVTPSSTTEEPVNKFSKSV